MASVHNVFDKAQPACKGVVLIGLYNNTATQNIDVVWKNYACHDAPIGSGRIMGTVDSMQADLGIKPVMNGEKVLYEFGPYATIEAGKDAIIHIPWSVFGHKEMGISIKNSDVLADAMTCGTLYWYGTSLEVGGIDGKLLPTSNTAAQFYTDYGFYNDMRISSAAPHF
jgi:hypothetical protein